MKKILLIGKNGQLGSAILNKSQLLGYNIKAFSREELDITDFSNVKEEIEAFNPEVVINASAYHHVQECEKSPEEAFKINTIALINLAKNCNEKGIKLVHFSTDRVFDGKTTKPYNEADNPNPIQVYGLSKYAGELICLNYNEDSIIIRTSAVFGGISGSRVKNGNFVLYILNESKNKDVLEISSEQIASFAYAEDLAKSTLSLLEAKADSGVYHLVNEGYSSWAEFADEITKIQKLNMKIVPVDRKGKFEDIPTPVFTALNNTKAKKLGIELPSWQDALRRYLSFLSQNP